MGEKENTRTECARSLCSRTTPVSPFHADRKSSRREVAFRQATVDFVRRCVTSGASKTSAPTSHRKLELLEDALPGGQRPRAVHHPELGRALHGLGGRAEALVHRVVGRPVPAAEDRPRPLPEEHVLHLIPVVGRQEVYRRRESFQVKEGGDETRTHVHEGARGEGGRWFRQTPTTIGCATTYSSISHSLLTLRLTHD